jgi:hypothetical protein
LPQEYLIKRLSGVSAVPILVLCSLKDDFDPREGKKEYIRKSGKQLHKALLEARKEKGKSASDKACVLVFGNWKHNGTQASEQTKEKEITLKEKMNKNSILDNINSIDVSDTVFEFVEMIMKE